MFYSGRKAVAAKDVAIMIGKWEGEFREYTTLSGFFAENILKRLNLKRMLPKAIKDMVQTVELIHYSEAKEYVIKQARVLQNEKGPEDLKL